MAYTEGHTRDQVLLLPASAEDYVAADNPVRFIDAFVEDLDLGEAGFQRTQPKATGRPCYDPADMLKLYLHGYLNRVRSSRRLAAEAGRNLELRGVRPDFRTIADFRRDNRAAFKAVWLEDMCHRFITVLEVSARLGVHGHSAIGQIRSAGIEAGRPHLYDRALVERLIVGCD